MKVVKILFEYLMSSVSRKVFAKPLPPPLRNFITVLGGLKMEKR
ncbi:MAG: hypothetical protein OEY49_17905 [Candidatus Heimdallarchaeota archaeon]|nr:hypothetical protein [Candidatus Heimdallarchaeota archaeon]